MKITIERKSWIRGDQGLKFTCLFRDDGHMCCLGFLGAACGIPLEEMLGRKTPAGLETDELYKLYPIGIRKIDPDGFSLIGRLIVANDSPQLSEEERESKVRELMAEGGVEVDFV